MIETHRHKDDLSFLWSESGVDLVVDAGKYAYTRDKYRQYIKSLRAHNTLLFKKKYRSKGVEKEKEYDFMPDYSTPIYKHTKYGFYLEIHKRIKDSDLIAVRKFYFSPGLWLVVCDQVTHSNDSIQVTSHLHFAPEFNWIPNSNTEINSTYSLTDGCNNLYTKIATNNRFNTTISDDGEFDPTIDISKFDPNVNGFVSRKYKNVEPAPFLSVVGYGNMKVAIAISLNNNDTSLSFDDEPSFGVLMALINS